MADERKQFMWDVNHAEGRSLAELRKLRASRSNRNYTNTAETGNH